MKVTLIFLLLTINVSAQGLPAVVVLDSPHKKLTGEIEFLLDPSKSHNFSSIRMQEGWKNIDGSIVNFGLTVDDVWLRFRLITVEPANWILYIPYPLLDHVHIQIAFSDGHTEEYLVGDLHPVTNKPVEHSSYVFPLNFTNNTSAEVYLKVSTEGAAEIPIEILHEKEFKIFESKRTFSLGLIYGVLGVMALYNLFIYLAIRERAYLFYVINVFSFLVTLSIYDGNGFQYIWRDIPDINRYLFPIFNGLIQFTSLLFVMEFLQIFKRKTWYRSYFKTLLVFLASLPFLSLILPYHKIISIEVVSAILMNLSGLSVGVYLSIKGDRMAKYFTLAWSVFISGMIIANLKSLGLVPSNLFTMYVYQIGSFIEVTVLSIALARKIEESRQNMLMAQSDSINYLKRYQSLYDNSLSGHFRINNEGRFLSINPAFSKSLGFKSENDFLSNNPLAQELIVLDKDVEYLNRELRRNGKIVNYEAQLICADKNSRWFSISIRSVVGDDSYFEGSTLDITERKLSDEQRIQSEKDKMAAMEYLVIGVCHEMNTPLGVVATGLTHLEDVISMMELDFDKGLLTKNKLTRVLDDENETMKLIKSNVYRVSKLIKDFKNISIIQKGYSKQKLEFKSVIENSIMMKKERLKGCYIDLNVDEDLCMEGYPNAISDIVDQLLDNTIIHAYEDINKGNISISICEETSYFTLIYVDKGKGLAEEDMRGIFNPFYTTNRGSIENTGLGMFQVYNIVTQLLGGEIRLMSPVDSQGMVIEITIPKDFDYRR